MNFDVLLVSDTLDFFSLAKRALLWAGTQADSSDLVGIVQLRSWID